MSRKTEMIVLIVATVIISALTIHAVLTQDLWRVSTLCYIAGLACMVVGWIKFYNDGRQ